MAVAKQYDSASGQWKTTSASVPGAPGAKGDPGLSAYEQAVANGFVGNITQWLVSLQGAQGLQGIQGPKGDPGTNGTNGTNGTSYDPATLTAELASAFAARFGGVAGFLLIDQGSTPPPGTPANTIVFYRPVA